MFSDSPWIAWKHAYRNYALTPLSGAAFARKEASAAKKCNAILFASDWAIKQGQKLYGISDHRFYLCPFGATRVPDLNWEQLTERVKLRNQEYLHILFIGKDWDRKGGPLAVEITRSLNAMGVQSFLDIVGCRPAISKADRFVRIHGLIRGEDPRESKRLQDLFLDSNFLLVPTNAECFGIVFAEAAAHCLPVVSQMVQAVPSIVIDGETGILQHPKASAQSYARRIIDVFRDESRYLRMALAARKRYEENFTWDICARRAITALEEHLK